MYDYLSIYSVGYTKYIKTDVFEDYLISVLKLTKISKLRFVKEISGKTISITGLKANSHGNYAIHSFRGIKEINLIEIDIPENINANVEREILNIATEIANEFSFLIDLD